jgi:hypothetical protein
MPNLAELAATGDLQQLVEALEDSVDGIYARTIVMSQACDLENEKVTNVILCPIHPEDALRPEWERDMTAANQKPTDKAWKSFLKNLRDGRVWNLALLEGRPAADAVTPSVPRQVVDFQLIYTLPRTFLTVVAGLNPGTRLRLLPPYREHLSQAFARYFMRVGLPEDIKIE